MSAQRKFLMLRILKSQRWKGKPGKLGFVDVKLDGLAEMEGPRMQENAGRLPD